MQHRTGGQPVWVREYTKVKMTIIWLRATKPVSVGPLVLCSQRVGQECQVDGRRARVALYPRPRCSPPPILAAPRASTSIIIRGFRAGALSGGAPGQYGWGFSLHCVLAMHGANLANH